MTVLMALALLLAGLTLSVLQVQWALRAPEPPARLQDVGASLPRRTRIVAGVCAPLLLFTGVVLLIGDQPWWVRWPAFIAAAAAMTGVQGLALRRRRAPAAASEH